MHRRTFLKLIGLGTVAAVLPAVASVAARPPVLTATFGALTYRGEGGQVLVSRDAGRTWSRHSNLGPEYRIARLDVIAGRTLRMTVDYGPRDFALVLAPDGHFWRTA